MKALSPQKRRCRRASFILITSLLATVSFAPWNAQATHPVDYDTCRNEIDWRAWKEQREFRAVLFGLKRARDAATSEVRFARDKSIWIKTQIGAAATSSAPGTLDEWRSTAQGYESITWYNSIIDSQGDIARRTGIFEARRRLSSELIPNIIQSYRTLECRLDQLCRLLEMSDTVDEDLPQDVTVNVLGCVPLETQTIYECHFAYEEEPIIEQGTLREYCKKMTKTLRERESQTLRLVIEYDGGYRSILQLSGMLRGFLGEMRGTVLGSLRGAANLIATLNRIPCFIGSCDDAPSSLYNTTTTSSTSSTPTASSVFSVTSASPASSPTSP